MKAILEGSLTSLTAWRSSCVRPGWSGPRRRSSATSTTCCGLWDQIRAVTLESTAPTLIHEEANSDQAGGDSRPPYTRDIDEILVSGEDGYRIAKGLHADADAVARKEGPALQGRGNPRCSPPLSGGEPDRRDAQPDRPAAVRRLHRDQPDRGAGRDRRELRPLDAGAEHRGDRLQDQSRGGRGGRPPAPAARSRRTDRESTSSTWRTIATTRLWNAG